MAYLTISLPPGLYGNGTLYQAKGRYHAANLMRFSQDEVKPVGGWQVRSPSAAPFAGAARAVLAWTDNSQSRWIAVGTHSRLYVQDESGANHDITPVRRVTSPLGANPIAATNASSVLVVTDPSHGAAAGDGVIISGAAAFAGLPSGALNQAFSVLSSPQPTVNTYAVDCGAAATATASGGGGAIQATYEMSSGLADATQNLGYGGGAYGANNYGAPRPNTVAYLPATVWTLDNWGEHLVACNDHDGRLYEWPLGATAPAAAIANAPDGCVGLVVTGEGFLFALGADGDGRRVTWCDQQNDAIWTADATNQAGDFDLSTAGVLMAGKALAGQTLLLTDVDAWTATYIGAPLVYGFQRAGSGCGLIAKGALAALDAHAVWMGQGGFWLFNGQTVEPLDCEVSDAVFGNFNADQASKAAAVLVGGPGEVWWFYPSSGSTENDSYVAWAYRESRRLGRNIWTVGQLTRLAGAGKSVGRTPPLMVDDNGYLYEHETGLDCGGVLPFLETGPIELAQGDRLMEIQRIVPDERNAGDVEVTLTGRLWPNGPDLDLGTYSLASPTDLLVQAREVRVRYTAARKADFRIGGFRLDVVPGDGQ